MVTISSCRRDERLTDFIDTMLLLSKVLNTISVSSVSYAAVGAALDTPVTLQC